MPASIKVKGLKELDSAFKAMDKGLQKELRSDIKRIVEPVAVDARRLAARFGNKTAGGLQAGARAGVGVVRQRMRRTTGAHPEFAGLLVATAMQPALDRNEDVVVRGVEDLIDRVADREGF